VNAVNMTASHGDALNFDRVVLDTGAGVRTLTAAEFLAMPLSDRIRAVLERRAEFYLGTAPVDRAVALASMRRVNVRR
jgi:hypothetical protein